MLFFSYAHAVGFPAYFSTSTPSFRSATYRLASRVGFLACFLLLRPRRGFPLLLFYSHTQVNIFVKRNYVFSVIKSCIPFTKQHIYATLNTTRLSSLSASYFIQKICFTIQIFTHPHRLHFTVLSDNSTCFRIKPAI